MQRRSFLAASSILLANGSQAARQHNNTLRRVAVIGHTGRGNYGHGLDRVWKLLPEPKIVAIADENAAGLAKELKQLDVDRGYTDYREMLEKVKPEFVSVAPRHADQHHEMALAAIESGVKGLYVEKPFCRTPSEADSLIAACQKHGSKLAVAHRNRYHPALAHVDKLIESGAIGKVLEIRGRGKGDRRGGGEDLWVLGSHVLNLIHHFAGAPTSCSATMLQNGRPVEARDVKPGAEGLGPLAADEVHVRYETEKGIVAYYDSIANDGTEGKAYCMQLIGSEGIVTWYIDRDPVAYFAPGNPYLSDKQTRQWIPITTAGVGVPESQPSEVKEVHNHVIAVRDLIAAVDQGRKPLCDIVAGALTVEMICAVFESHRQEGRKVGFPLVERGNALEKLSF